jgi:hypothetical protein
MMSLLALGLPEAMLQIVADHERDAGERLLELLKALPPDQRHRYRLAAKQAGYALEMLKPAIFAMPRTGMVAGVFSRARAGEVVLVAAEAKRSIYGFLAVAGMDAIVAAMEAQLGDPDAPPEAHELRRAGGMQTIVAKLNLREFGRDTSAGRMPGFCSATFFAGTMLAKSEHRDLVQNVARLGLVPAVVCLLSRDRHGSVLLPLVHGQPWPELALSEEAGAA